MTDTNPGDSDHEQPDAPSTATEASTEETAAPVIVAALTATVVGHAVHPGG